MSEDKTTQCEHVFMGPVDLECSLCGIGYVTFLADERDTLISDIKKLREALKEISKTRCYLHPAHEKSLCPEFIANEVLAETAKYEGEK